MSILEGFPSPVLSFEGPEAHGRSPNYDALVEKIDARFDAIESRLDVAERLAAERHSWTLEAIARLAELNVLRERIGRLEAREQTP
jgi:hypothetical protein